MANSKQKTTFGLPLPYRYVCYIGLLFTVVFSTQPYVTYLFRDSENPFAWFFYVSTTATHYFAWVLLTPVLYKLSRLRSTEPIFSPARILIHSLLGVLIGAGQALMSSSLRAVCYYFRDSEWMNIFDSHGMPSMVASVFSGLVEYWVIIGAFIAIDTYLMYRAKQDELIRMENELNNAQLHALKMQLHPHFLFNTLHSISSLMNENIQSAQKVVTKLGYLLRTILDSDQANHISLREELEYVRSYLDIEEIRFEDRLRIAYSIEEGSLDCLVPNLVLQPLVENAIKHGFQNKSDGCAITVSSQCEGDRLILEVADNGGGCSDTVRAMNATGVGLRNVRTRIAQMYGGAASFVVESTAGEGFLARIRIPCSEDIERT